MLTMLRNWKGAVEIDGTEYKNIKDATSDFKPLNGKIHIKLHSDGIKRTTSTTVTPTAIPDEAIIERQAPDTLNMDNTTVYRIKVKKYMTQKATPAFDFMEKWNNDEPMPLRVMVGTKDKETKGMVHMALHADILQERTMTCMRCGKKIANPVSQYFGMGPECGCHNYTNPFGSDAELKMAVESYRKQLRNIKWTGWIIRSAIEEMEEIEQDI
jgi:hypothetical protein